ncbi:MAG: hypothetical protein DMG53_04285 [Acidobacteria bacterium]|nr:MAG: hypothetical protein DMG53_04285 [Acidobacteriota bacterium]
MGTLVGNWKMEITGRASRASDDSPKESRSVVGLILQLVAENTRQKSGSRIIVGSCKTAEADLRRVTENPSITMSIPLELEFVLVSSDYAMMNAVSGGVKKYGAKFLLVPTAEAARDCLSRRRIDGVFVDLEVPGALGVMEAIRKGTSNSKAVIFACVTDAKEYTDTLSAGANFLLRKPLHQDSVALHITIAKAGASVTGKGQVAWINTEGMAGIVLQTFDENGREHLEAWLAAQEQLGIKNNAPRG